MGKKKLIFSVTNDLVFDQRMQRICTSLQQAGYDVMLVGFSTKSSPPLSAQVFKQKRFRLFFSKGKLFYLEYNLRLFIWLLFQWADLMGAIDLDTIIPVYYASRIRNKKRVYDAHELFCEMKEVVSRPTIFRIWKWVEKKYVPRFPLGYTVNAPIAQIFKNDYGVVYEVIRNVPVLVENSFSLEKEPYLLYQGAVNEGRNFETLIPAMQWVDLPLWICGDGNFMPQVKMLVAKYNLQDKVIFKGKYLPEYLRTITANASLGFTLFENNGLSNYLSLANRFFDYLHGATPQICVDFPVYRQLNNIAPVAVLVDSNDPVVLADLINKTLADGSSYRKLQENCLVMREKWCWQQEEIILSRFYQNIFSIGA
ncbi:glycosyltransferase [Flavihumibacter sp.]|uniref:glycosyltransferase n=1 Tax=Flavihumibacter sp. TaxID=1913981 RepID=UPI002FC620ED